MSVSMVTSIYSTKPGNGRYKMASHPVEIIKNMLFILCELSGQRKSFRNPRGIP